MCVKCSKLKQRKKGIKETSYSAVGRKYGVSNNAIRKWKKIMKIIINASLGKLEKPLDSKSRFSGFESQMRYSKNANNNCFFYSIYI